MNTSGKLLSNDYEFIKKFISSLEYKYAVIGSDSICTYFWFSTKDFADHFKYYGYYTDNFSEIKISSLSGMKLKNQTSNRSASRFTLPSIFLKLQSIFHVYSDPIYKNPLWSNYPGITPETFLKTLQSLPERLKFTTFWITDLTFGYLKKEN